MSPRSRISINDHSAFRQSLVPRPEGADIDDDLDDAMADPVLDRLPAYRSEREKSRLDGILDDLERGGA